MIPIDANEDALAREAAWELRAAKDALVRCVIIELSNRKGRAVNEAPLQQQIEDAVGDMLMARIPMLADRFHPLDQALRAGYHDRKVHLSRVGRS